MSQDTLQRLSQRLQESNHLLVTFPHIDGSNKESGDALGSALALFGYLNKIGKKVDLVAPEFKMPDRLSFLPHVDNVQGAIDLPSNYTLRIKTDKAPIKEWSYGLKEGALEIYLKPEHGILNSEDLELHQEEYKYDTIVTLDTPDLPALGRLFEEHSQLFYDKPIINIDHHVNNEHYGQINMVDINASATGEIVAQALQEIGSHHLDEHIATNLFTAIFLKTNGFKNPTISPNTLKIGAELIQLGARREEIMQNVFRARSLASLRLWGRALAHLKFDPATRLTWATLTLREILESGGNINDLPDVIDELIFTSPEAQMVVLICEETEGRVCVMLASRGTRPANLPWEVTQSIPGFTKYCLVGQDLVSAEQQVVEKLKNTLNLLPQV